MTAGRNPGSAPDALETTRMEAVLRLVAGHAHETTLMAARAARRKAVSCASPPWRSAHRAEKACFVCVGVETWTALS